MKTAARVITFPSPPVASTPPVATRSLVRSLVEPLRALLTWISQPSEQCCCDFGVCADYTADFSGEIWGQCPACKGWNKVHPS